MRALGHFDESLTMSIRKTDVVEYPHLHVKRFLEHCCEERHYFFDILKCGSSECRICKPPTLSTELFQNIKHFPDLTPGTDGHLEF